MNDGLSRFKQMLHRGTKPRRDNWRQPITPLSTSQNTTESVLFDQLLPEQQMSTATEEKIAFDKRIDQIGLAEELVKLYSDPMRDDVKATMGGKSVECAEGTYFDATLTAPTLENVIEPAKFYKLLQAKKINVDQFLAAISVKVGECKKFMAPQDIEKMSTTKPKAGSLKIVRKKGVALALLDCLHGLAEAIRPKAKAA